MINTYPNKRLLVLGQLISEPFVQLEVFPPAGQNSQLNNKQIVGGVEQLGEGL